MTDRAKRTHYYVRDNKGGSSASMTWVLPSGVKVVTVDREDYLRGIAAAAKTIRSVKLPAVPV